MTCDPGRYLMLVVVFSTLGFAMTPVGFVMGRFYERYVPRIKP